LNTYGVAEYKLPARASLEEIELIRGLGVEFPLRVGNSHASRTWSSWSANSIGFLSASD